MYSFYQQLRTVIFGGEQGPVEDRDGDANKSTPIVESVERKAQERYFTGVVTNMDQSSGMIDNQVFFELEGVIGGKRPVVGSSVHVHARRDHRQAGWKALRVEVTSQWQPEGRSEREVLNGYIGKLSPTLGVVDCGTDEVSFFPREVAASGYRPHVNDWVQLAILHQDGESKVTGISPLRERRATGTVTFVSPGFGIIDDDVYYTFSACLRGYQAKVGDRVVMECVEYHHPKSNWRAVLVEPALDSPLVSASLLTPPSLNNPHPRLLEDKGGIVVGHGGNFGTVDVGEKRTVTIVISNYSDVSKSLISCKPLFRDEQLEVVLPVPLSAWARGGCLTPAGGSRSHEVGCPGNPSHNERGCLVNDEKVLATPRVPRHPEERIMEKEAHVIGIANCVQLPEVKTLGEDELQGRGKGKGGDSCDEDSVPSQRVEEKLKEKEEEVGKSECNSTSSCPELEGLSSVATNGCEDPEQLNGGSSGVEGVLEEEGEKGGQPEGRGSSSHLQNPSGSCSETPSLKPAGHLIPSGENIEVTLHLSARTPGRLSTLLIFNFHGFKIARHVQASIADPQTQFLLQEEGRQPWRQGGRRGGGGGRYQAKMAACRVPGERPLRPRPLRLPHRLKAYPIPDDLRACVEEDGDVTDARVELGEPLCMENYSCRFSALVHLEELRREDDIRQFDMCSVDMRCHGSYLSLAVPGLAEGRPSLLVGDKVIVCEPGGNEMCPHWEGFIHELHGEEVHLKFSQEFHDRFRNEDYDVMFTFTRTPLRRMHHAAEMAELIGAKCLFPGLTCPKPPLLKLQSRSGSSDPDRRVSSPFQRQQNHFFNPILNARQRAAVNRIVGAQGRPAPYVLFGPPGTGKTVTLVEAILQVHKLSKASRILACAPSNSATDLLAERLHQSGLVRPGVMVRLNAVQRFQLPPPCVQVYCMDTDSVDIAARSRIVVATCVTAGMLHSLGLGVGHFSHVFVDEAGQATEPECLISISLLAGIQDSRGQVILAGDPHQLGPVLASPIAGSCGLRLSLLERLMERPAYQRDETRFGDHGNYDPLVVTKLVSSYRAHPSLLRLYSDLFYDGELEASADPRVTHALCKWELLPNKGFPLVFHGVQGEDMQEGNSPSWFNPVEVVQVVKYTQALRENSTFAPKLSDIGIITPYRKQVEKIRLFLGRVGLEDVKVGSVEEFQGQERLAIIISTVRSTPGLLDFDIRHHLGFLSNPKRFNVAISRAQALLVVIGNPHLLSQDPYWSQLVDYAVENLAYTGCPLPSTTAGLTED